MRTINTIVVHCSYTKPNMNFGVEDIRRWHTDPKPNGRGWSDVGYHYVIRRDGTIENGRPVETPGAHVAGHNADSIGICLVGGRTPDGHGAEFNYTFRQLDALWSLVNSLVQEFGPNVRVCGHKDFPGVNKTCPNFEVEDWWAA